MAEDLVLTDDDRYAAGIFFYSALPLLKVIVDNEPKYGDRFKGKSFVFQVSAKTDDPDAGLMATHFVVTDGVWQVVPGKAHERPDIEFAFSDLKKFVVFFAGKGMPLPKIKGFRKLGTLVGILLALLRMAGLLQAKDAPTKDADKEMLVRLYFYLLPSGISRLNKMGHPKAKAFTEPSPDRAYAYAVTGHPELKAWLRIKAGNSKSGRGEYPRCKPFLTMRFDTTDHALDILMSKADMIDYLQKQFLIIEGAPEFGAALGDLMLLVGYYAQGQYM